jgi:dCTP deaminase
MILSDASLRELIRKGDLSIDPLSEDCIQPASIDCRLGTHFLVMEPQKSGMLSLENEPTYREVEGKNIVIQPHTFLLATTVEYIKLPNGITAFVEGRSSIGRIGLFIQNAGWVDAGFEGRITLELYNANSLPIRLQSGRRICQLVFCKMDRDAEKPYRGKYHGQLKSMGSRIHQDREALRE